VVENQSRRRRKVVVTEDYVARLFPRARELARRMQAEAAADYAYTPAPTLFSYAALAAVLELEQAWPQLAMAPARREIPETAWAVLNAGIRMGTRIQQRDSEAWRLNE
jgi:hypothetical protein